MIVAGRGSSPRLPEWLFRLAQAVVGCLIARSLTTALFRGLGAHFAIFIGAALSVLLVATALGMALTRLRILPGSTALWGSFPGAATVMVLLSESFGGDMRLVALMQFLRVAVVATAASVAGRIFGAVSASAPRPDWLAPIVWPSFAVVLAIVAFGAFVTPRLRIPAGPLLVPLAVAALLQDFGALTIELPRPLLAASYLVIGWAIGLRFTRDVLKQAASALPRVLAATVTLVVACASIGWGFARVAHVDGLTAYLATSPGGADSVAIIAAGTAVDAPLVMAVQTGRFLAVLLLGPALARGAARLLGAAPPSRGEAP
jgi:membrane AbrB-like protein